MGTSDTRNRKSRSSYHSHGGKTKSQSGLCYSLSPNSLWSVWYCIIVVAVQIYIITTNIKSFGQYISLPWPIDDQPYLELNAYVGFLGASVVIMPFFVAAAILRVGNYPNDGRKICFQTSLRPEHFAVYENVKAKSKDKRARILWRHGAPLAPFLHVAAAFCLLLPKVLIQAQLIKHGFLKKSELWNSELDFVVTHRNRLVSLSFIPSVNESEIWTHETNRLELVVSTVSPQVQLDHNPVAISAEFLNFAASLLIYAIRYPSVFWDANKAFGFLFSLQLLFNGFQQLLAFTGFSVLYKVQIFNPAGALIRYTPPMMNATTTMLLFFVYNVAMTATSCTLHCYGLQKYREWVERRLRVQHISWVAGRWRLWGYTPHVFAFVVLVTLASSAAPFVHDFTIVYWGSLDGVVLAAVTGTIAHLFLWIVLWLFLTVKQRWTFQDCNKGAFSETNLPGSGKYSSCNGHAVRDQELSRIKELSGDPPPLLVIDREKTYQIREKSCQKAILSLASQSISRQKTSSSTDDEDIYWLKPRLPSPKTVVESLNDDARTRTWARSPTMSLAASKSSNVVSEETHMNTFPSKRKSNKASKFSTGRLDKRNELEDFSETASEDGDYAILSNHQEYDIAHTTREIHDRPIWKGVPV